MMAERRCLVKICGITSLEDALAAAAAGAELLGFNFYPKSPRYLTPGACAQIVSGLRGQGVRLTGVGVFVNAPVELIATVLDSCGLDLAQLSGDEPVEHVQALAPRAYKALRPTDLPTALEQAQQMARPAAPALLVDAHRPGEYGGTGQTGDWPTARALAAGYPLLLAGGLTPDNVARAVTEVQPWGVDVASGVESAPGIKDPGRMQAFIRAVRLSAKEIK